jgi:hypothetical protein
MSKAGRKRPVVVNTRHAAVRGRRLPLGTVPRKTIKKKSLTGVGVDTAQPVRFRPRQVRMVVLRRPNGRVVGACYPLTGADRDDSVDFARAPEHTASKRYYALGDESEDDFTAAQAVAAPWRGSRTFFAKAHSSVDGFFVTLRRTGQKVGIDGATYGRLLAANPYLRKIYARKPDMSLIMLSCVVAHPAARSGPAAANALQRKGFAGAIFAPTGRTIDAIDDAGQTSVLGVEQIVDPTRKVVPGGFVKFPD